MIRANRQPVPADNPLLAMEQMASEWITIVPGRRRGSPRDTMEEQMFLAAYGAPWLQALMGFGPDAADKVKRADHDLSAEANEARLRASSGDEVRSGRPARGDDPRVGLHPSAGAQHR